MCVEKANEQECLHNLNSETLELIGSGDFELTLKSMLDMLGDELLDNVATQLVEHQVSMQQQQQTQQQQGCESIAMSLPFAKLIPIVDASCAHTLLAHAAHSPIYQV